MQEIKFRGKRIDNGEWAYGNLLELAHEEKPICYIIPSITNGSWSRKSLMLKFISPCFEVIPETVGQFTGHINKDGKEIYDSDICVSLDGLFLVVWNEEKAAFEMMFKEDGERLYLEEMWDDTKVIGNLHDNLELWEVV